MLDNVHVPVENALEVGKGQYAAFCALNMGRFKLEAGAVGGMKYVLRACARYARERRTFGHYLGDYGLVKHKIAEMAARTFALESMVYRLAGDLDGAFDGIGLRGNDSSPVSAEAAKIPATARLGDDGAGFGIMMSTVLPWFNVLSSAVSCGLMETAVARTAAHVTATKFEHVGQTVADLPTVRAYIARMRIATDHSKTLLDDTLAAMAAQRADTMLRVLETKAGAGENAAAVTELAMRVCGGAAFRKEVGVERVFRDARAAQVMAPTTDALYDFIGKAACGLPVF